MNCLSDAMARFTRARNLLHFASLLLALQHCQSELTAPTPAAAAAAAAAVLCQRRRQRAAERAAHTVASCDLAAGEDDYDAETNPLDSQLIDGFLYLIITKINIISSNFVINTHTH